MYNSDKDPNVSLGLNFIDTCMFMDDKLNRSTGVSARGLGSDVKTSENFTDVLRCVFSIVEQARNEGFTGVYKLLPYMQYLDLQSLGINPARWVSVRVLGLLPKYMNKRAVKRNENRIPLPSVLKRSERLRLIFGKIDSLGGEPGLTGYPLSFVPDIDLYWLKRGDTPIVDVFQSMKPILKEAIEPLIYGEGQLEFPAQPNRIAGWFSRAITHANYIIPALCFLAYCFPQPLVNSLGRIGVQALGKYPTPESALRALGDQDEIASDSIYPIVNYGMNALYMMLANLEREHKLVFAK